MSFHSATFVLFFAAVTSLYYLVPNAWRPAVLLVASVVFYLSFAARNLLVFTGLVLVTYCLGILIERAESERSRKAMLSAALAFNIGVMGAFKYVPDWFGVSPGLIPVGLSFHAFQAMAYAIEVYRRQQPAERSLPIFSLYIIFFPQIAAGPIERPQAMLSQFRKPHPFRYDNVVAGLQLMAWGLFQKYVVADRLAAVVHSIYDSRLPVSGPVTAYGAICFSFQIFCDFAGYSEIALGAAQVFGLRLTRNFNAPFHADSMAEYWKRWHISLSTWMRDYVFFPLCGRRPRMPRVCASIIAVFLANGLWHGARLNYLASGFLHGVYRVTEILAGRAASRAGWAVKPSWRTPVKAARTLLVFSLMTFAFVFFRGENLGQSLHVTARLFSGWQRLTRPAALLGELDQVRLSRIRLLEGPGLIAMVEMIQYLRAVSPLRPRIAALPAWGRWSIYYAGAAAVLFLVPRTTTSFIYFGF